MTPSGYSAETESWRLVWDPSKAPFPLLIGGADWAVELTAAEASGLRAGLLCLLEQLEAIADQLMEEELISLELERGGWWLGLDGHPGQWGLRCILLPAAGLRGWEGAWAPGAGLGLARALEPLPL